MERGQWRRWEFLGVELAGKTLGIVGIGRIGTEVAKRARILGLEVIAYDPYVHAREVKARGARKVGWLEFLRKRSQENKTPEKKDDKYWEALGSKNKNLPM